MKTCVVLNPHAGPSTQLEALEKRIAERLGRDVDVVISQRRGAAERVARQAAADGCELIIAAGGDGTLNHVINGVSNHFAKVAVGLLPLGTGNDFARTINMPADLESALDALAAARMRHIDVIRSTTSRQRYFVNVSAGGFGGVVNENLTREIKDSWGPFAYLRSAATALTRLQPYHASVSLADDECLSVDLYNIVIANGRYVAGGLPIAPDASIDDGLVDVVLLRETSPARLALLGPKLLNGSHLNDEGAVVFRRAARVCINSRSGMPFNVDGELIGEDPIRFDVLPRTLRFVVP